MEQLTDWYEKERAKIERKRESDKEVARLTGQTLAQFDADCSKDDPRGEAE